MCPEEGQEPWLPEEAGDVHYYCRNQIDLGIIKFCRMFLIEKHNSCCLHIFLLPHSPPQLWEEVELLRLGLWARLAGKFPPLRRWHRRAETTCESPFCS